MKISEYIRDGRSPIPKDITTSRVMRANKGKHTSPEIKLRAGLRAIGLSDYRLHSKNLPGRPDVVFPKQKLAVFVNGCFWHRCPYCKLDVPKTHSKFWGDKFKNNIARDKRNVRALKKLGWKVSTVWECRLKKSNVKVAQRIAQLYHA